MGPGTFFARGTVRRGSCSQLEVKLSITSVLVHTVFYFDKKFAKVTLNEAEMCSLVVAACTRHNIARINLTVLFCFFFFYQSIPYSCMVISSIRFWRKVAETQRV